MGNHYKSAAVIRRSVFDRISLPHLDHQKDPVLRGHSSVFDHLEWPDWHHQKDRGSEVDHSALNLDSQKSSRVARCFQILKGKQPAYLVNNGPDPSSIPICGKCTRASSSSRPCKYWIKCFYCGLMGHVAHHCETKWKKVARHDFVVSFPKTSVNKMSSTLKKIWIAKDAHAGGASGSKASILDMLIEASKDAGESLV
jgi:hypothetical protein